MGMGVERYIGDPIALACDEGLVEVPEVILSALTSKHEAGCEPSPSSFSSMLCSISN